MRLLICCFAVVVFCMTALACTQESKSRPSVMPNQDIVVGVGTVVFSQLEGGFFAIRSDDGVTYAPRSWPDGFMIDGLRVFFTLRVIPFAFSIGGGTVVEIVDIRELT